MQINEELMDVKRKCASATAGNNVDEHHRALLHPRFSPTSRSLAHRSISLYIPETPLNRYLEHIRGFIPRL